jgi:hypothetical protein
MPVHTIYYGATIQDGVLVPSTGEVILSFQSNARTVRGTTTADGRQLFSVLEFINLVCVERGGYGAAEWRRLKSSGLKNEIRQMKSGRVDADLAEMVDVKVKKHSKYKYIYVAQPAMTVRGLQWLLAQLGAGVDEFFQVLAGDVFAGYLAGERGMVHAGVASLKVVSQRTLNRRERAGGAEVEAVATAEGPAKRKREAAVAVVMQRDRTLSQRTLDKREAAAAAEAETVS